MTARRKYKQLKFGIEALKKHYDSVCLSFVIGRQTVRGVLKGNHQSWVFVSDSRPFLSCVPSGQFFKYALWIGEVPADVSLLYNAIWEAAIKEGYDLSEEE
ncbi:MAG: hypothetical protein JWP69_280 [Flaviaesturariibacter sp.]|nr:hypothetical protein [Flaviaesturariibacter sp.]